MRILPVLCLTLLCAMVRPALCADTPVRPVGASAVTEESKALGRRAFARGIAAYQLEKYDQAVVQFQEGYRAVPQAVFLYNIAQAYRLGHKPRLALTYYQRYLKEDPGAQNRAEVEDRIATLEKQVAEIGGEPGSLPDRTVGAGELPAPPPPPLQVEPPPAPLLAGLRIGREGRKRRRIWPIVVGAVGGAVVIGLAVGLGVYYGTAGNNVPVWQPVAP